MKFIDRRSELDELESFYRRPPSAARHRALISFRRMGKTELIGEFRRRNPKARLAYLDVEAARTQQKLVLRLFASVIAETTGQRSRGDAWTLEDLLILGSGKLSPPLLERVRTHVTGVAEGDAVEVLRHSLLLAEEILTMDRKNGIIFFDECQSWFAGPDDEPTDYEAMLREVGDRSRIRFVFSGSARRVMDATFREAPEQRGRERRPLHGRVGVVHLSSFGREDTRSLVRGLWARLAPPVGAVDRVFALTRGHPAAATHLAERAAAIARGSKRKLSATLVSEAFAIEVFERGGYLNAIAEADYAAATTQPRGADTLKRIVDAIVDLGPHQATQARIAQASGVSQPNVVTALPRLLDIDFVLYDEDARTYTLANPIVGVWLRGRELWSPGATTPIAPRISQLMEEEIKRLSEELGTSFEARVRDVANRFDGRQLPGRLFGQRQEIAIPRVQSPCVSLEDIDREGLVLPRGTSVELDLFIDGPAVWLGEARHRRRAVSARDMKGLLDKVEFFRRTRRLTVAHVWFVSNAGFDERATALARQHDVLHTTARQLDQIRRALRSTTTTVPRGIRQRRR